MKPEIDRVRNDLTTIEKAMGLAPSIGREWILWLKRDTWLHLLWCLPGAILITSAWIPLDNNHRHLGLVKSQWVGILVAAVMLGILGFASLKMSRGDNRPVGLVREYKRINALSWAYVPPLLLYFIWARQYDIGGRAFMAGLWLLAGSATFVGAICARLWVLLGWAIPLMAFGLLQPASPSRWDGFWLGMMFVSVAVMCSVIQTWQLRGMEKQHATY